jgi:hypothetical protein
MRKKLWQKPGYRKSRERGPIKSRLPFIDTLQGIWFQLPGEERFSSTASHLFSLPPSPNLHVLAHTWPFAS